MVVVGGTVVVVVVVVVVGGTVVVVVVGGTVVVVVGGTVVVVVVVVAPPLAQVESSPGRRTVTTCCERRPRRPRRSRVWKVRGPPEPKKVISRAAPVVEHLAICTSVTVLMPGRSAASWEPLNWRDQVRCGLPTESSWLQWSSTDFRYTTGAVKAFSLFSVLPNVLDE